MGADDTAPFCYRKYRYYYRYAFIIIVSSIASNNDYDSNYSLSLSLLDIHDSYIVDIIIELFSTTS